MPRLLPPSSRVSRPPSSGVQAIQGMVPLLLPHLAALALVGSSARLSRHATRPRPLGSSMSLPLDSSLIIDTVSPAIERRMQALACAVPVAISVLATRSSSGIPQIAEVMGQTKSKTPSQVATKWGPRVFFGDAVVYMSRFIYHMRRGYPLACWSELIPLMLQNVICFYLTRSRGFETDETNGEKEGEKLEKLHCHHRHPIPPLATQYRRSPPLHDRCTPPPPHNRHCCSIPADVSLLLPHPLSHYGCLAIVGALARPWARQADQWLKLVLDAAFLAALGLLMLRLPTRLMPLLCLWSVPLSISSYTVQALETVRTHVETRARYGLGASTARAADWPRQSDAWDRPRRALALSAASGEPAGRSLRHVASHIGPHGPSQHVALGLGAADPLGRLARARGDHRMLPHPNP